MLVTVGVPVVVMVNVLFVPARNVALFADVITGPVLTATTFDVPVMDAVTVSVTVMVCVPFVTSVAERTLTPASPAMKVYGLGNAAPPSVLEKLTVPR